MDDVSNFRFSFERIIGISTAYSVYLIYSELIDYIEVESELINKLKKRVELLRSNYRELYFNYTENREFLIALRDELIDVDRGLSNEIYRVKDELLKKFIPEEYATYN